MTSRLKSTIARKARSLVQKLYPRKFLKALENTQLRLAGARLYRQGFDISTDFPEGKLADSNCIANIKPKNDLETFFDSRTEGPGIWKWRHYFEIYDQHFKRFRETPVRILEIGVYSGGSLEMWSNYFGRDCVVYGLDIEDACKVYERQNIKILTGDQSDRTFWKRLKETVEPFDIIIDDGGHLPNQQLVTLEESLVHLNPGGVYLCEDVAGKLNPFHAYLNGLTRGLHANETNSGVPTAAPNAFQRLVKSVHYYPFVVIIETNSCPLENFSAPKHGTQWQPFFE